MIVCTYEDRPRCMVGIKLLVLSLTRHCPDIRMHLFLPGSESAIHNWAAKQPIVESIQPLPSIGLDGWDVKPGILLDQLARGLPEVWWLDSDILVTRDWRVALGRLPETTLIVAEENAWAPGHGSAARTVRLGLEVARVFPTTLCSCILRVSRVHEELLVRWSQELHWADYRNAQRQAFDKRDWVLGSDQDLLTGLLGSATFGHIAVHALRSGRDIAHCFCSRGYGVRDRLRNVRLGLPPLVHAQGPKPWDLGSVAFAQLSPYCQAAGAYAEQLGEPADWLRPRHPLARALDGATMGNPNLRDLPWPAWATAKRGLTRLLSGGAGRSGPK